MIEKFGIQLYLVRNFMTTEEDVRDSLFRLKKMGYDQVQTYRCQVSHDKISELARETGIEIIGAHENITDIENDFENIRKLGTSNVGVGWYSCSDVEDVKTFAERVKKITDVFSEYGMKFTYHHHSHELVKLENGVTALEMLAEVLDPDKTSIVLDTFWIQHGGGDVREWIEKLAGRVDILHLKDMKRIPGQWNTAVQTFAEVGSGNLNWKGIIESAENAGVKYYVVEQDADWNPNCFASARKSAEYLKTNFMK